MVVIDDKDIGKSKLEILTDLLYESLGVRIPQDKIKYKKPKALDVRPDILDDPNTFIPAVVDIEYCAGFTPDVGFMYRRRTLKEYFDAHGVTIAINRFPITTREIIAEQVNQQVPFPIDPLDIVDEPITDPEKPFVVFTPEPDSFIWTGKLKKIATPLDPNFFKLVTVHSLDGFKVYQP